jgi:hypothetical protein
MFIDLWKVRISLDGEESRIWVAATTPAQATKLVIGRFGESVAILKIEDMGTGELLGGARDQS